MSIRSTAKAIIVHEGKVLLNRCKDINGEYYALPGGGQNQYEPLNEAVVRECLEETGLTVRPVRMAAVCEVICTHEGFRQKRPEYAHKMYHIILCALENEAKRAPTEMDSAQVDCEWIAIEDFPGVRLLPEMIGQNMAALIDGTAPVYLGVSYAALNHG